MRRKATCAPTRAKRDGIIQTASFLKQCVRHLLATGFALACLVCLSCSLADDARADDQVPTPRETVTVAYYEDGDYMLRNANNEYSGFNIDYLEEIALYAGWNYEYVDYGTWERAYDALVQGDVDILPSVYHSAERDKKMLFSKTPVCSIYTAINVRIDDDRFAYDDYEAFQDMKVGVIGESLDAEAFEHYCEKHNLSVETIPYSDTPLLISDLEQGILDAIAITYLGTNIEFKTVAQFSPEPLYIAIAQNEADLKTLFDDATDRLLIRNPDYFTELYKAYFSMNTKQDPVFTRSEYAYIESAPVLTVAYDSFRTPLSYTDPTTGEFTGVAAMLFADIARTTGLRFEYVPVDDHNAAIDLAESGEVDIVYAVDQSVELSPKSTILTTGPYLKDTMAKIVGGNPTGTRIALPEGFSLAAEIAEEAQGHEAVYYKTPKQCFDAILEGKADIAYADIHVADYLLSEPQYNSLSLLALTDYTNNMSIGVSASADPQLVDILDRCIQFTSDTTMTRWITETALIAHPASPIDIVRQYPLQIIGGLVALLLAAIGVFVYIYRSKSRNAERIVKLVYSDSLTGGWNLNRFQVEASKTIGEDDAGAFAILFFDISRFKSFNAAFGYAEGDRLLLALSRLLDQFDQEGECHARINADQFVALLRWHGMADFTKRFDRLDACLNDLEILRTYNYRILLFGGIALPEAGSKRDDDSISDLIDQARYARESILDSPHSTIALYTADMKERDIAQRALQSEAVAALANGEFVAYYQPKVAIDSGRIVGFEALVRWIIPGEGMRSPAEFIGLFERTGFVTEVDLAIFAQACAYLRARIDQGSTTVPIACNFSRLHLLDDRFPSTLKRIVDEHHVPVELLELELTESIVMEDLSRAESMCGRLKELGFRIAIDDFGSGYSSLGALQNLPVDILKIDQSFLLSTSSESRSRTILEGIIAIAERLGTEIVVEGIETLDHAALIRTMDPRSIAQGYLYSRPVSREEADRLLDCGSIIPS
ncbi:EAL domain-containing protein [Raoultibacter phocaeensis]|uniref:EAL domain-containing protein n=1 Tax=Raoultibacter phocaeensis TaxID=2479841 RepID=UPI002105AD5F|nr:EAL domain-containing protein [Raoultibacter phocaeensis]